MKKTVSVLLITLIISFAPMRNAHAEPISATVITATALGGLLLAAGGAYYYKPAVPPAVHHAFSLAGTFGRVLLNCYYQLDQYNRENMMGALVTAKANFDDLLDTIVNNPTDYPNLYAASQVTNPYPGGNEPWKEAITATAGQYIVAAAVQGRATSVEVSAPMSGYGGWCYPYASPTTIGNPISGIQYTKRANGLLPTSSSSGYSVVKVTVYLNTNLPPLTRNATAQEFRDTVAPTGAVANETYENELDSLVAGHADVVHFVDTANPLDDVDTAPPYAPPVGATAAPTQPAAVTGLGSTAATQAAAASQTANSNLAAAKQNYDAAKDAYAANPTPEALDALKAAEQALTEATQAAQAAAQTASDAKAEEEASYPGLNVDTFKSLNFSKWLELRNVMANTWPFTLLTALAGYVELFLADGTAPTFDLPIYGDITLHCDLSPFDPVATCVRYVFTIFIVVGGIYGIVRFYRGVV